MTKMQSWAFVAAAFVLAACEPTPPTATPLAAPESVICGADAQTCTFDGTWTLNYETTNPANPIFPGDSFSCDGSITLTDYLNDYSFEGTWFINPDGSCGAISPVSGEVQQGRIRADGGLDFFLEVPPLTGPEKSEDDIWEDIFAGTGVIVPALLVGCGIADADNQMDGALIGPSRRTLSASASAKLTCDQVFIFVGDDILQVTDDVHLQIRFDGNR